MRLEFDIDSEVYPELHAALSALTSTRARAERLRQLAAAGLVWEKVRIHGSAAVAPAAAEPARRRSRPGPHDSEQAIRELPVLRDVVPYSDVADVAELGLPPEPEDDDEAGLPEAALHVTALSHKPATRSRLMRMKERGLFKNG